MSRHELSHRLLQMCRWILFTHFTQALANLDMRDPGNFQWHGERPSDEKYMPRTGQEAAAWFPFPPGVTFGYCSSGKSTLPSGCGSTLSSVSPLYEDPKDTDACAGANLPNIQRKNSLLNHQVSMPGAERIFVATSILVPFYWENIIHVNMDLCSTINNLEPDLSLTRFPSSLLTWWQTLGVGRFHLLLASGAALYVHLHQRAPGGCCADLRSSSLGGTEPHCACWRVAVAMKGCQEWLDSDLILTFSGLRFISFNFTVPKEEGSGNLVFCSPSGCGCVNICMWVVLKPKPILYEKSSFLCCFYFQMRVEQDNVSLECSLIEEE